MAGQAQAVNEPADRDDLRDRQPLTASTNECLEQIRRIRTHDVLLMGPLRSHSVKRGIGNRQALNSMAARSSMTIAVFHLRAFVSREPLCRRQSCRAREDDAVIHD